MNTGGIQHGSTEIIAMVFISLDRTDPRPDPSILGEDAIIRWERSDGQAGFLQCIEAPVTEIGDPWEAGGWGQLNATDFPGEYRVDLPNAMFAAGAEWVKFRVETAGGGYCPTYFMALSASAITPSAVEIDDRLTTTHGAGSWVSLGEGGSGAYPTDIIVLDQDDIPIQKAFVRCSEGIDTHTRETDAEGKASFGLDDGIYTVSITKAGYTFAPEDRTVTGENEGTLSEQPLVMTKTAIGLPPADPTLGGVYIYTSDLINEKRKDIEMSFRLDGGPTKVVPSPSLESETRIIRTDADGLAATFLVRTDVIDPPRKYIWNCGALGVKDMEFELTAETLDLSTLIS